MTKEKNKLQEEFTPLKSAYKEMSIVKKNIEDSLGMSLNKKDEKGKDEKDISNDAAR